MTYVGNFDYLAGEIQITGVNPVSLTIQWVDDPVTGAVVGTRIWHLDPAINSACQYRIPNLGRFVSDVQLTPGGALPWTEALNYMWASNRPAATDFTPLVPALQRHDTVAQGAGTTLFKAFEGYGNGWASFYFAPANAPGDCYIQAQTSIGVWRNIIRVSALAGAVAFENVVLPPTSLRTAIVNTGGVASNNICGIMWGAT